MTYTLFLTLSQPLTATALEKIWDAEQRRRCPDVMGRAQVRVHALGPHSFELTVTAQAQAPLSPEESQQLVATALRRDYPQCHLDWGVTRHPECPPRKGVVSEPGRRAERQQQER